MIHKKSSRQVKNFSIGVCTLQRNEYVNVDRLWKITFCVFAYLIVSLATYTTFANGITNPKVKWKFKTQGTIRSSAVVEGNNIYFGSADGFIYSLATEDGDLHWKFQTEGAIAGSPAVSGEAVIFSSRDNHVYAVNKNNGGFLWKYKMQPVLAGYTEWEYFTAAPVVSGGKVFVGSGDGHLYALHLRSGKLLWKFKTGGRVRATPLVVDKTIYQPSNDGIVYVLSTDGKLLWNFKTEGASLDKSFGFDRTCIFSKPCLKDGLLVFGARDGKTYAVDVATHEKKWQFTYGSTWAMSTALADETVFVGWSTNKKFCAIDLKTGEGKWEFSSGSVNYTTASICGEQVVFGSADGNLYSLNKTNGNKNWQYSMDAEIHSSPVHHEGALYVGCDDGFMYALEERIYVYRAVYQPGKTENYPTVDAKITPYLRDKGFQQLDSATLYQFIVDRVRDKAPSVIVFAYEVIPDNIVGRNPKKGLMRQYLDQGGKIIWFGGIPNLFAFDTKGKFIARRDVSIASELLDVDFATPEESGNYYSRATQTGLNYGLPTWFKATYAVVAPEKVEPLAFDENNRVTAWMKKFNERPGSGFICCRSWAFDVPIRDEDLWLVHRLATHALE
jgi:outer membrane protein assembly factor BamB